jgi:DNA replication protein DnaC
MPHPNDTLILKTLTSDNTNMTDSTTKYLFFTGKGGVGKTSLALQQL